LHLQKSKTEKAGIFLPFSPYIPLRKVQLPINGKGAAGKKQRVLLFISLFVPRYVIAMDPSLR
jgi:hypothetical protein